VSLWDWARVVGPLFLMVVGSASFLWGCWLAFGSERDYQRATFYVVYSIALWFAVESLMKGVPR